jgi:uncharacterized integral membrane protein
MQVNIVLVLIITVLISIFAVQNTSPVDINFLGWSFRQISLVLVIIFSFAVGALAVFFLALTKQLKSALKIRELSGQNKKLAEEIEGLKSEINKQKEPAPSD